METKKYSGISAQWTQAAAREERARFRDPGICKSFASIGAAGCLKTIHIHVLSGIACVNHRGKLDSLGEPFVRSLVNLSDGHNCKCKLRGSS